MGCRQSSQPSMEAGKLDGLVRAVLVAGPPAAGKGTQCDWISARYGLVHISSGQVLREQAAAGTALGLKAKAFMDTGELVPSELLIDIIESRIQQPDVVHRGCLLDNFPLTADQARAMQGRIEFDQLIIIDVPDDVLVARAMGRRLDPQTGCIYHKTCRPAPPEVEERLVRRSDDNVDSMRTRLETFRRHFRAVLPFFRGKVLTVNGTLPPDEVFAAIVQRLDTLNWCTSEDPYFGSAVFSGPFSAEAAKRAGFFSPDNPPQCGERVVCFRRGLDWQKRGVVIDYEERVSAGMGGLREGADGVSVTVEQDDGQQFQAWSAFLAPVNDMEYSSICTTSEFQSSLFSRLYSAKSGLGMADAVSKQDARASLDDWLQNLEDADGEPVEVTDKVRNDLLVEFDEHQFPSIYLYTTHHKLAPRTSLNTGQDYSLYYRAINNTLNSDSEHNLRRALPLLQRMIYMLLYDEDTGNARLHKGGRLWKGDTQMPVPLNMHKLQDAAKLGGIVRFRQFLSTTSDEELANKYRKREDSRGYLWIIDVPPGFWGAFDVHDVAWRANEAETLFPPYSAFRVQRVDANSCHLAAVDRRAELDYRAVLHGVRGSAVELLKY